jgi:PAS domain S-box-containing protein
MSLSSPHAVRKCGIRNVDALPRGAHLCQFYETRQDLLDILVPYFAAGLDSNELCVWITSEPLQAPEAHQAMMEAVPDFDRYVRTHQMEIVPWADWYLQDGFFSQDQALEAVERSITAMADRGYSGLRASGNLGWLQKPAWNDFSRYEGVVDGLIGGCDAMSICSYPLGMCGVRESLDVMSHHRLALIKHQGAWQVVENTGQARTVADLRQTEEEYRRLFESTQDGIEVIDGITGRVVLANQAAARMFGYDTPGDMVGIDPLDRIPAADRARVARMMSEDMFEKDMHRVVELRALSKDGTTVWLSAIGIRTEYQGRLAGLISLRDVTDRKKAEEELQRSLGTLERTVESAIQAIASTVETKDVYTAGHQRRVTQLACAMALEMDLPKETIHVIRTAGLLHDLGKISLPTDILTKPGQLTQLELAVIRTHPQVAYDVLKNIESFDRIALVVLQHHERINGSGYPSRLHGKDILLEARILAVSDVIEAMYSYRPYRPALGLERALQEVTRNSGTLYDPAVVDACLKVFHQGRFQFIE